LNRISLQYYFPTGSLPVGAGGGGFDSAQQPAKLRLIKAEQSNATIAKLRVFNPFFLLSSFIIVFRFRCYFVSSPTWLPLARGGRLYRLVRAFLLRSDSSQAWPLHFGFGLVLPPTGGCWLAIALGIPFFGLCFSILLLAAADMAANGDGLGWLPG
jgi:hypothetical protein